MSGILPREFDPAAIARSHGAGGAACLPVLTDRDFFQGALDKAKFGTPKFGTRYSVLGTHEDYE